MINLNKKILLILSLVCFSAPVLAGPTAAPVETALGKAQVVIQKLSTQYSKLIKDDQNEENKNLGEPQENAKKEKEVKNETLVTNKDATPLTFPWLNPYLAKENLDIPSIHSAIKKNGVIDYKTIYQEDKTALSFYDIDPGISSKIKDTSAEDALVPNSQEAMQSIYHMTWEQGRAVAQKSFALMDKNKDYKEAKKADTAKRKTTVDMEKGNAMANQNSSMILNEIGLLRFLNLEAYSLGEMQDKGLPTLAVTD